MNPKEEETELNAILDSCDGEGEEKKQKSESIRLSPNSGQENSKSGSKTESIGSTNISVELNHGEPIVEKIEQMCPVRKDTFHLEPISESNPEEEEGDSVAMVELSTCQSEPQSRPVKQHPQPVRQMTLPSIHIMDEYGQHTESINIDTNNNNLEQLQQQQVNVEDSAVMVKNINFSYTKKNNVLSNVTMTVPKGKIFALLGSSGCGKTTLLRIILGRIRPRRGEVHVFGAVPGSVHSNVPGNGVGYMPQDLALLQTFTIEETFYYYGTLHNMSSAQIAQKTDFLIELLNLPPKDRKIANCSGGQQRRASIATTLFHSPPLLILDEPTVGVDPLLRCKIWQYLEYLCLNNAMTVIITTHYIEESRNADNLAFMRFGRILSQDSPDNLLAKFNCTILEDVFLKLCQLDCGEIKQKYSVKKKKPHTSGGDIYGTKKKKSRMNHLTVNSSRMKALLFKNVTNLKRNPLALFFFLILPVIQIVLFCSSLYKKPDNLPVSVYNGDNKVLSKRFLSLLDTDKLSIKNCNSHKELVQTVIEGRAWYGISIDNNFTKAYRRRAKNPADLSDEDFQSSKIKLFVDTSDNLLHEEIFNSLMFSYQMFVENVAESFGFNRESVKLPIDFKEIVHGHFDQRAGYDILTNLAPGAMIAIIYTTPLIMAAFVIVLERKGNLIERTFVSGATSVEVFMTHLITMMIILIFQVALLMIVTFVIFELNVKGSLVEVFIIIYMQGLCGIFIGLLISSISKNEIVALLTSFGMIFPVWMMCGVFWPLESIVDWLQRIFWGMPLSMPIRSVNLIIKRGWSFEFQDVQNGYLVSLIYNSAFFIVNILIFHFTSK